MPSANGQFGASGGMARLTVCADFQAFAPVRVVVETPACRQAAATIYADIYLKIRVNPRYLRHPRSILLYCFFYYRNMSRRCSATAADNISAGVNNLRN